MSCPANPAVSMPRPDVDPLFTAVTPVFFPDQAGHATGFYFVDDTNRQYLITNHHVVSVDGTTPRADTVRVLTRPSPRLQDVAYHDIPLAAGGQPTWIEHPLGPAVDVAAIPLPFDPSDSETVALHSGLFPDPGWMPITQHGTIIGYPLLERTPFLPFLRDATIATPYGTTFRDAPCFAMDAHMHAGTSGSPVFALPESTARPKDMLGHGLHLIGIHSATIVAGKPATDGVLDLNIAWYSQLLEDMLPIDAPECRPPRPSIGPG